MLRDTTPEAARLRWEVLARMSGEQRLREAIELTDFVLRIHAEGQRLRAEHRPADETGAGPASPRGAS